MAPIPYTWLLFDADGTLFDYDRAEHLALERTLAHFGVALDEATLRAYRRFNGQVWTSCRHDNLAPLCYHSVQRIAGCQRRSP